MELEQGTPVKILSGPYRDAEGVIEDVQPECSAVRIETKEGRAYAMLDDVQVVPEISTFSTGKRPLRKK
jgi:transcription antitermination factor NusG